MPVTSVSDAAVGLLLSGGLDSSILLAHLLESGRRVQPFYVQSGLYWQRDELWALRAYLITIETPQLDSLIVFDMPLADLYGYHWSITGRDVPGAETPDSAVYLPGRNALLTIKPALWCAMHGVDELALAVLASNPFSDATAEFFRDFERAIDLATNSRVRLTRPFAGMKKPEVMQLGRGLPLALTFSCIAPVGGLHCGRCNKCAERQQAFNSIGEDPTTYANQNAAKEGEQGGAMKTGRH
jgi:7-cyano-7-deazaguanine synthase